MADPMSESLRPSDDFVPGRGEPGRGDGLNKATEVLAGVTAKLAESVTAI